MRTARNILLSLVVLFITIGCKDEVKSVVQQSTDPKTTPTMLTTDITTLVSDSGVTKYRITSERWEMYDECDTPNWVFPKGIYLEQFDTALQVEATFECDKAIYLKNSKLWHFIGNVRSSNTRKEIILTNELYWDQNLKKVYSDSFIHIEQPERILEGFGFESNERLTTYKLKRPMGIFPVDEERRKSRAAQRDSLNALQADSALTLQ